MHRHLSRSKNVIVQHDCLGPFLIQLKHRFLTWTNDLRAPDGTSPRYQNLSADKMEMRQREFVIKRLLDRVDRISGIVQRETDLVDRSVAKQTEAVTRAKKALEDERNLHLFGVTYVGPGILRPEGPRHDNDFVDVSEIQVAPTDKELLCEQAPFLPCIIPNAPHPYPSESMSRVIDTQFRLLREDLLYVFPRNFTTCDKFYNFFSVHHCGSPYKSSTRTFSLVTWMKHVFPR